MHMYIDKFFQLTGYNLPGFRNGFELALAGVLTFIIILHILGFLLFSKKFKKSQGLFVEAEKGKFYISRQAIADLVKTKEVEFPGLTVQKTYLMQKRKRYTIKIVAELNDKGVSFPELVIGLQNKVLSALNDNLGIDSIKKVDIELTRVISTVPV